MIETRSGFPDTVVAFRASGHVTRQDYETVVVPAVEEAFKRYQALRLYSSYVQRIEKQARL